MFSKTKYKLSVQIIGLSFFGFLFMLSWYFFKERMLAFDSAFFSFNILQDKTFGIALGRWGSVITQFVPIVLLKQGCSLETFLRCYSVSFIIFYYILFLLITLGLNNYRASIALMLSLCLAFRMVFYYAIAELYQGMALTILLWAIIAPEKAYSSLIQKRVALFVSLLLIYVMSYFHQLTVFTILFVLLIELIGNKRYNDRYLWATLLFTVLWYAVRIKFLTNSDYEKDKIPGINIFFEQIPNLWKLPSTLYFKEFANKYFLSLFLVYLFSLGFTIIRKKLLLFFFLLIFPVCFLLLILITYYKGESNLMYENYYTVLGFFVGVAFVFTTMQFQKKWLLLLILPLLVINLKGIYDAHYLQTKRVQYIDRLVSYSRGFEKKKFLISSSSVPGHITSITWAFPFETLMYSSLEHPDSAVTFFIANDINKYDSLLNRENIFLGPEWAVTWFWSDNLNKNYFRLPSSGYEKLSSLQSDSTFVESDSSVKNIHIIPLSPTFSSDVDSFVVVPVKIINNSGKRIAALQKNSAPVFLSYHIYKQGKQIVEYGVKSPLEVDIINDYIQGTTVMLPEQKGEYIVKVDFITQKAYWWGINSQFKLIVK